MLHVNEQTETVKNGDGRINKAERDARNFCADMIAEAKKAKHPFSQIIDISPAFAKVLLENNPDNRKLRKAFIKKYVADMQAGRWESLNGQTIVIAKNGEINDGQNRLEAIIEAGVTLPFMVVWGAERDTRMTLDQGATRSAGDYLGMVGIPQGISVAAVARFLQILEAWSGSDWSLRTANRHIVLTKTQTHDYAVEHENEILDAIRIATRGDYRQLAPPARIASAYIWIRRHTGNSAHVRTFFDAVLEGEGLKRGHPAMSLRRLLSRTDKRLRIEEVLEIFIKGWNSFAAGEERSVYQVTGNVPRVKRVKE